MSVEQETCALCGQSVDDCEHPITAEGIERLVARGVLTPAADFQQARADKQLREALAKYGFTLDGLAEALSREPDPGRLLSDVELEAAEALVRAALRWTDTPKAKVVPAFDLIMAELRRLRGAR